MIKEYKEKKTNEINKLRNRLRELEEQIDNYKRGYDRKRSIEEIQNELFGIEDKIEELKEELYNKDYTKIIKHNIENNIQIILTEEDKELFINEYREETNIRYDRGRKIEKLEDIMLVHKTDYIPQNSELGTRMTSDVVDEITPEIEGKEYKVNLRPYRNTLHFAVNHEVISHGFGNWSKKKYMIIVPLTDIPKEKIRNNNEVDTYTRGEIKLTSNCYIICPKEDIEKVKKENPQCIVIGYDDTKPINYANTFLWFMGYPVEDCNEHGFNNNEEFKRYADIIEKSGYYKSYEKHYYSEEKEAENKLYYVSFYIGLLELIMTHEDFRESDPKTIEEKVLHGSYIFFHKENFKPKYAILINSWLVDLGFEPNYPLKGFNNRNEAKIFTIKLIKKALELNKQEVKKSR